MASGIFYSKHKTCELCLKNRPYTDVARKSAEEGTGVISKKAATRRIRTNNRTISVRLHPGDGRGLPNNWNNISDTPVGWGNPKTVEKSNIIDNTVARRM